MKLESYYKKIKMNINKIFNLLKETVNRQLLKFYSFWLCLNLPLRALWLLYTVFFIIQIFLASCLIYFKYITVFISEYQFLQNNNLFFFYLGHFIVFAIINIMFYRVIFKNIFNFNLLPYIIYSLLLLIVDSYFFATVMSISIEITYFPIYEYFKYKIGLPEVKCMQNSENSYSACNESSSRLLNVLCGNGVQKPIEAITNTLSEQPFPLKFVGEGGKLITNVANEAFCRERFAHMDLCFKETLTKDEAVAAQKRAELELAEAQLEATKDSKPAHYGKFSSTKK